MPAFALLPASLALWAPGSDVLDDYRPLPASPLVGAGFAAPLAPATDAGPFGAPAAGALGTGDDVQVTLLRLKATLPAPTEGLGSFAPLRLRFAGGTPTVGLVGGVRVLDGLGGQPGFSVQVDGNDLLLTPDSGGWGSGELRLELHRELATAGGVALAAPVVVGIVRL